MTNPAVRTVFLPPAPAHQVLTPDPQFFKHNARIVSVDSELAFSDARRMHIQTKGAARKQRRRFIPDWAHSNASFRAVVRLAAEKYIGLGLIPTSVLLETLIKACNWRTRGIELRVRWVENPYKQREILQHVGACRRAGSYISLLNYVGYTSWRCCEESTTVASITGYLTPAGIRQLVCRLGRAGRLLGLETTPQHNRKHDAPPRRKSRGRGFRFLTKQDAEGLAWKYFCGRSGVLPPPPAEMSPKDLAELVVWRAEGHALKASWCTGRALEAAQNRAAAGVRLIATLAEEKAA